jgi:hypothetical protein
MFRAVEKNTEPHNRTVLTNTTVTILDIIHRPVFYLKLTLAL